VQYSPVDLKLLVKPGAPQSQAEALLELWNMVNDGLDKGTSPDFERLMGRAPASVETFLTSHAHLFH